VRDEAIGRYLKTAGPERRFWCEQRDGKRRVLDSYGEAFRQLKVTAERASGLPFPISFDCDAVRRMSEDDAWHCAAMSDVEHMRAYARGRGLEPPRPRPPTPDESNRLALIDPRWWFRRNMKFGGRQCEDFAREYGMIHVGAAPYISAAGLQRFRENAANNQRFLEDHWQVDEDTGLALPATEVAAASVANPALRRAELMLRARGMQEVAERLGHLGMFATLTNPSAFHAHLQRSGEPNPRFRGFTVLEGQLWLREHWARVRAELARRGVQYYGFRVAEPHHDATPHWHLIVWAPPDDVPVIEDVLWQHWLRDPEYRAEPGALEYRVRFKREDPSKGSAVAYIAKYVAKNIAGASPLPFDEDPSDESGLPFSEDSERAVAWARIHGIRQFQQIGGPCVTLWRELRRIRVPVEWPPIETLRQCVEDDESHGERASFARLIEALGGIALAHQASRQFWDKAEPRRRDWAGRVVLRMTKYGEYPSPRIVGLMVVWCGRIRRVPTHATVWLLVYAPQARSLSLLPLGPVGITVRGAPEYGSPAAWPNPRETSRAPPAWQP
jgi:hypothetical protein